MRQLDGAFGAAGFDAPAGGVGGVVNGCRSVSSDSAGCGAGGCPSFAAGGAGGINGLPSSGMRCTGVPGRFVGAVLPALCPKPALGGVRVSGANRTIG